MTMRSPGPGADHPLGGPESTSVVVWPVAKIDLVLRVLARRDDGFHEIDTVLQAIDLADRLRIEVVDEGVELVVEGAELGPVAENLCYRAAEAFLGATRWNRGVSMHLLKGIPSGAGLGGGSSDAASTLLALNALAGGPLPRQPLGELAASLGSDVPFFLGPASLARGTGRGELLEPLPSLSEGSLVVVMPPVHVDTGPAYRALSDLRASTPDAAVDPDELPGPPSSWRDVVEQAANDFEAVVAGLYPEVADSLRALRARGASPALLCGSGAASFGVFSAWTDARAAAEGIRAELGFAAVPVRTLSSLGTVWHEGP